MLYSALLFPHGLGLHNTGLVGKCYTICLNFGSQRSCDQRWCKAMVQSTNEEFICEAFIKCFYLTNHNRDESFRKSKKFFENIHYLDSFWTEERKKSKAKFLHTTFRSHYLILLQSLVVFISVVVLVFLYMFSIAWLHSVTPREERVLPWNCSNLGHWKNEGQLSVHDVSWLSLLVTYVHYACTYFVIFNCKRPSANYIRPVNEFHFNK